MTAGQDKQELEIDYAQMKIDEEEWKKPSSWRFGLFYYSKIDSRMWVPKRTFFGRRAAMSGTPNFAKKDARTYLMIIFGFMLLVFLLVVGLDNAGYLGGKG